jgi:5-methyltetrahydropteroyltriglutamate--homocysteine methyltransferase
MRPMPEKEWDHIPTTHVGSLPRPPELIELLHARKEHEAIDEATFQQLRRESVTSVVQRQLDSGLDVVNDGELGRLSFSAYVMDRIEGFEEGHSVQFHLDDLEDFPAYAETHWKTLLDDLLVPSCVAPVAHRDLEPLRQEIADLTAAIEGRVDKSMVFMNAATPGQLAFSFPNRYYRSHDEYVFALADAMRPEYEAVAQAGFTLQLDSPDLAMSKSVHMNDFRPDFAWYVPMAVEALNHAVQNIPPEQMRLHICWGNGSWPHHHDAELAEVLPAVLKATPRVLSIEGGNPRHAHEWQVFKSIPLPEDKILMPGVIETTTTFIEHPDLVALRVEQFASVVGKERLIASTDCGFATHAEHQTIDTEIAWAKLASLVEGTRRASERLS